ncbi:MAG: exosortase/archaeosortase family protein [Candidatus Methylacidiphilales bacterium]
MDPNRLKHPHLYPFWLGAGSGILVLLIAFAFFPYGSGYGSNAVPVFSNLWWMWHNMPEWEHSIFVPVICMVLIYLNRSALLMAEIRPESRDGGVALGLAALAFWVGFQIDIVAFSFIIIHLTIGALILWFLGWQVLRAVLFPFAFLVFAWPFPFLDGMLAFPLRLLMSEISHVFLNMVGVANVKVGTSIVSAPDFARGIPQGGKFALDVANPCSGIRSLFALTMVTALYAYFSLKVMWKQWALFLCAAPLAVMGNFGRILMLTFGTLWFGSDFAIGSEEEPTAFHMASGFFVFVVALGGMVWLARLLEDKLPDHPLVAWRKIQKSGTTEKKDLL